MIDEKRLAKLKSQYVPPADPHLEACGYCSLFPELADTLEALLGIKKAAQEVLVRYKDPYSTQVRIHAAFLEMEKDLAAWREGNEQGPNSQ
jgi:hypothetical protein